jgi:hypothetical protein
LALQIAGGESDGADYEIDLSKKVEAWAGGKPIAVLQSDSSSDSITS